ncbi:MAG: hypothetical protein WAV31_03510 [Candidatus Moraniibacteriota bacterium]
MTTKKVRPIKPSEVAAIKKQEFPAAVFEAFNELISSKFVGGSATIKQKDVVVLMVKKGLDEKEISEKGWLNVEAAYRAAGWKVKYDSPGFNETYDATFEFSTKRK